MTRPWDAVLWNLGAAGLWAAYGWQHKHPGVLGTAALQSTLALCLLFVRVRRR